MASGFVAKAVVWGRRLQSDLVLRTARTAYLVIACISVGLCAIGLAVAIAMQASTLRFTLDRPLPPAQAPAPQAVAMGPIDARLSPPSHLRFEAVDMIDRPLAAGDLVGRFEADTANGLAAFPDDFEVVGGKDAALFDTGRWGDRTGLRASAELAAVVNAAREGLTAPAGGDYVVRVVARDAAGGRSAPADVVVRLTYGPPGAVAEPAPEPGAPAVPAQLLATARAIALKVDPQRTDVYFEIQKRALALPRACGAAQDDPTFIAAYAGGFEHVRARLSGSNVEPFFLGMCEAWSDAVQRGEAAAARSQAARADVMARNMAAKTSLAIQKAGARQVRNAALVFVLGAFLCFLAVALLLAFLAIEGHSRAMRLAVETLASRPEGSAPRSAA